MIEDTTLWTWVLLSLVLLVTPGPAVAFVVARSLEGGPRAGLVSQAGLCAGLLIHVAAAALGLSALVARSAEALSVLRLLGAAYLTWLGIAALTARSRASLPGSGKSRRPLRLFLDGLLVDTLNPKPALFFLALLPQFVDPGAGPVAVQMATLGLLFVALAFVTGSLYAMLAGWSAATVLASRRARRWLRRVSGWTYLALGAAAVRQSS